MSVKAGDTVIWRGRRSRVRAVTDSGLVLHVGEGQIVRDVGEKNYTAVPEPEPAPEPIKEPVRAEPKAKARRKVSTGKGNK